MKIYRPLWNEGALLSPQQFQQQAEWESFRSAGASALASPFPWGVEKVEFNDSLLSSGLIQITQLRLWLEEGSLIDAQRSDLPPPPRELDASLLACLDAVTVVIALPHMQPGVINVEQEGIIPDRPLRYREEWVTLQDAFGSEDESMAVARFNFTIRFAHESNDSWKVCPVARLIRDGQNAWRVDPSFIPPVASFAASPILRERLVLLNRQLRSRRRRLMTMRRESNERLADFAVADVSLFWLLNALNSHARVLTEFERFPSRPPEQVWAELARLAGSMLTFSLDHDLDAIPGYDHEEPANAFPPLEVQAQNAAMRLFAEKKLTLSSASDISFAGKKRITLIGGGSYLRLEAGKVEYGTTATYMRKVKRTMAAGSSSLSLMPSLSQSGICLSCLLEAAENGAPIVIKGE